MSSVTATVPDTVEVHLAKPYSVLPNVLTGRAGMIVSPAAVQKFGKDFARNPVGAGPFAFKSWKPGTQVDVTRYGGYWEKGQPKLAGITFKVIGTPASMAAAAIAGQVDIASIDPSQLPAVRAGRDLNVRVDPTLSVYGIFFNASLPPLDDVLVRRAVVMSLDRQAIAETTGTLNAGRVAFPGVDDTLSKILGAYTQAEQKPLYEQVNRQVFDAVPDAPTYYLAAVVSLSKRLRGYQPNIVGKIDATTLSFN